MLAHCRAGSALIFYAVATFGALVVAGTPGGAYDEAALRAYIDGGHLVSIAGAVLGMLGVLALLPVARGLSAADDRHDTVWGLGVAAVAVGIAGWWVAAALPVTFIEAGPQVTGTIPLAVVQTLGEVGVLMSLCGPAFLIGCAALVLARRDGLPTWVRVAAVIGGVCGIASPLFLTAFVYLVWAIVMGAWMARARAAADVEDRAAVAAR